MAANTLPADSAARVALSDAMRSADDVLAEGRNRIQQLRGGPSTRENLAQSLGEIGARLSRDDGPPFKTIVLGTERRLKEAAADAAFYIAREALLNAFRHARASSIELELTYATDAFGLRSNGRAMTAIAARPAIPKAASSHVEAAASNREGDMHIAMGSWERWRIPPEPLRTNT